MDFAFINNTAEIFKPIVIVSKNNDSEKKKYIRKKVKLP
jgi:hypothetical protein